MFESYQMFDQDRRRAPRSMRRVGPLPSQEEIRERTEAKPVTVEELIVIEEQRKKRREAMTRKIYSEIGTPLE